MIVRAKPNFWHLVWMFRLSILPRIVLHLLSVFVVSCAVLVLEETGLKLFQRWNATPFTLLGVALSIFLGFRNNACYDRWWEARRVLGALIGEMRSWARLSTTLPSRPQATGNVSRAELVRLAVAFQYALTAYLRGQTSLPPEIARYAPGITAKHGNLPDTILRKLGGFIGEMLLFGEIDEQTYRIFDDRLNAFTAAQVACERIRNTPTPFTYTLLLQRTAYAYCFMLPFGLTSTLGWGTPLFCTLVAYTFFGLDALGDELEEPFGRSLNALPLDAMARNVEISLLEAIGETNLPPPLEPVNDLLY